MPFSVPGDIASELFIIGIEGWKVRPQGHAGRAREGCHVDQEIGGFLVGQRQGIAKDQAAFRIGVADLHGEAFAAFQDIAGAKGIPGNGIFNGGNENAQAHGKPGVHDHLGEPKHIGGAAHVLFHQGHAGGGLDIKAARIKAHALADKGYLGSPRRAPGKIDEAGLPGACLANRMNHREAALQGLALYDAEFCLVVRWRLCGRRLPTHQGQNHWRAC